MTTPAPPRRARAALAIGLSLASACGLELSGTAIPYDGGTTHPYSGEDAFDGTMEDVADAGPADAPRDTAAADAASVDASDAPAPDATDASDDPSCSGLVCNGVCLPDASDCHACRGATLLCRSTRTCLRRSERDDRGCAVQRRGDLRRDRRRPHLPLSIRETSSTVRARTTHSKFAIRLRSPFPAYADVAACGAAGARGARRSFFPRFPRKRGQPS